MELIVGTLCAAVFLLLVILLAAYICFYMAFYVPKRKQPQTEEFSLPDGETYEAFRDVMIAWMKEVRAMPHEDVTITSFDGLTLRGKYYEYAPGAPIELMFHGYRGDANRDLCGGVQRCFALKRSALIVDQRACGSSEGNVITFGVNESKDCHSWLTFMRGRFGPDVKIILTGISMGAATVVMAAGQPLPENVIGVLADCGYTTAKEMICKTIQEMHLPPKLMYPFVKLGAKLYGGFDLEETSPLKAIPNCKVPVIFYHGEADDFVPCDMSRTLYNTCATKKALVTIPNAGHGLSFPVDEERYIKTLGDFFGTEASSK